MTNKGHDKYCLAAAIICAVENLRDSDDPTNSLEHATQDGTLLAIAEYYLDAELTGCRCR